MKKLIIITAAFLLFPCFVNAASISSVSPTHVTPGETVVTVSGSGFGSSSLSKYIYFGYNPAYSLSWSDTKITIRAPYDMYSSGSIKISGSFSTGETCSYGYCYDNTQWQELTSETIYLKPEITQTTKTVHSNGIFEILGEHFGSTQGSVSVGNHSCRILEWNNSYIKCEVSEINLTLSPISYSVRIPDSNNYKITGKVDYLPKISNDTYSFYQSYLKQTGVTDIWDKYSGKGVRVAVIDSGVDLNHPDLKYSLWVNYGEKLNNQTDDDNNGYVDDYYGYNFVDDNSDMSPKNNHGTLVSGIIAASRDNNLGIAGIAPNVEIMSLIACDNYGCSKEHVNDAIKYAVDNGADIINLSLGGDGSLGYDPYFDDAIKYAYNKDIFIVASAGNGDTEGNGTRGQDMDLIKASPICNENSTNMILGVGAINNDDDPTIWTNYSMNYVDVSAPGVDILSTAVPLYSNDNWYVPSSGTSFSAPIVAGIAALLKEKKPFWKNFELMSQIISRSDNFPNDWNVYGKIINAKNIINTENPQAELISVSPTVINKNSSILHIYGNNFYRDLKIKFYNNNFNGYIPTNIMNVSEDKISIDLSKWDQLVSFTGFFSLSIDSDNNRHSDKYTLDDAVKIEEIVKSNINENQDINKNDSNKKESQSATKTELSDAIDLKEYIEIEKQLITEIDEKLSDNMAGQILLQVESNGEGWYVDPGDNRRHFLGRPADAFKVMRELGLGVSNEDFESFNSYAPKKLSGKILLKVEDAGKAYYVNPGDLKIHYLGKPKDAFNVMRLLGLGISNENIRKIGIVE